MAKFLSEDLRSRVIAAVDSGLSRRAAADRFGVGMPARSVGCASGEIAERPAPSRKGETGDRVGSKPIGRLSGCDRAAGGYHAGRTG
jgi:hypothetical protein